VGIFPSGLSFPTKWFIIPCQVVYPSYNVMMGGKTSFAHNSAMSQGYPMYIL